MELLGSMKIFREKDVIQYFQVESAQFILNSYICWAREQVLEY